jgi:hypothetical protein
MQRTYLSGTIQIPEQQGNAIAPTVERVRQLDAKTKGRKRSTERQTKSVPIAMLPMVF